MWRAEGARRGVREAIQGQKGWGGWGWKLRRKARLVAGMLSSLTFSGRQESCHSSHQPSDGSKAHYKVANDVPSPSY